MSGIDILDVLKRYYDAIKLKREIMAKNLLAEIYESINSTLATGFASIKNVLGKDTK